MDCIKIIQNAHKCFEHVTVEQYGEKWALFGTTSDEMNKTLILAYLTLPELKEDVIKADVKMPVIVVDLGLKGEDGKQVKRRMRKGTRHNPPKDT